MNETHSDKLSGTHTYNFPHKVKEFKLSITTEEQDRGIAIDGYTL